MLKTSLTDPLQIKAVQIPGTGGLIGMTLCPGKIQRGALSGDWHRDLDLDLRVIQTWGAQALVTLMEPAEMAAFKVADLPERIPVGLVHHLLPIPDGGVPGPAWEQAWEKVGPGLRELLGNGGRIVIHCRGGLGRTGLLAARLLVEFGMAPEQAMAEVRKARKGAIENRTQEDHVRRQKAVRAQPSRPAHGVSPDRSDRFRGCLLAGAAGDALGAPVEFLTLGEIHRKFGPRGVRDMAPAYGRAGGAITDDTQMTLFTGEGVLRAHVKGDPASLPGLVGHAYLRWLLTQGRKGQARNVGKDGWLFSQAALFGSRAPGNTCLSALEAMVDYEAASPARNHSKGCGGVMRVAPIGLYVASLGLLPTQAFLWGCDVCALTHGHPTGQLPGGFLAMLVCELVQGQPLPEAIAHATEALRGHPAHEETLEAVTRAGTLAAGGLPAEQCLPKLGQGWIAEEALAVALFCALRAESLEEGVIMAANITGDSDSTAAITGNILGAIRGVQAIPDRWLVCLELREVITEMADDLATVKAWALDPDAGTEARRLERSYWCEKYPGW